ncbi:MAG: hypothetical protein PHY45_05050 [Rhodocyclaceae bacterium]|nr:hypothetical protein [Rhodocyclaceae bacterium]
MKTKATHEVIRVVQPAFLVNSAMMACRYETADGRPLEPGYYFALWPTRVYAKIYDREVRYFGPFDTEHEARLLQGWAAYLGIVAPTAAAAAARRCGALLTPAVTSAYVDLLHALHSDARLARCVLPGSH